MKINLELISKVLLELTDMGLLICEKKTWKATSRNIHLPSDHPLAKSIHSIWRNRTAQHLQEGGEDSLHYSAVHCLSQEDVNRVQQILKDTILGCRKIIDKSNSEAMVVFCLDWYKLASIG